jgi:hypothetical protein
MRGDLEILKSVYLPLLEEVSSFAPAFGENLDKESFWDYFNNLLLDAKNTGKELEDLLLSYKVAKIDYFTDQFAQLKNEYISYLAAIYCNGESNPTIELLQKTQYAPFIDEIAFQKDLRTAITITERARLKKKLALTDDEITFDISDREIASAFAELEKKKERDELKRKMQEWDKTEQPAFSDNKRLFFQLIDSDVEYARESKKETVNETKRIPLSFIKYAVAACFVGAMVWIGVRFFNNQPTEHNLASNEMNYHRLTEQNHASNKIDTIKSQPIISAAPEFAKVDIIVNSLPLMQESGLGYGPSAKANIKLIVTNLEPRIASLEKYINSQAATKKNVLASAQGELDSLKKLTGSYTFDGKSLQLFSTANKNSKKGVLRTSDNHYYYRVGDQFFALQVSSKPMPLAKFNDKPIIDKLERIIFDNEK